MHPGRLPIPAVLLAALLLPWTPSPRAAEEDYETGSRLLSRRDYQGAIASLSRAAADEPQRVDAWLKLGMAHAGLQDWKPAEEAYRRVLELDPHHKKALHNLGNVFFRQGRHAEAATYYGKAREVDPDYLLAAFHHGWVLRQLNRPAEAEAAFTRVMELTPANDRERKIRADSLYYLGTLRFRAGDHATAAGHMRQVLEVSPGNVEARYYLGMALRELGRIDEAREQLEIHRQLLDRRRTAPVAREPDDS